MPSQTVPVTGVLAKMGGRLASAHAEHKDSSPETGHPQVPAGIEGGVAQVNEVKIGVYQDGANKGKPFFYAGATIHLPQQHNGIRCSGMTTKIGPEPLCDTPQSQGKRKTFEDHYKFFIDHLKVMGFDVAKIPGAQPGETAEATGKRIEAAIYAGMAALKKRKPWISFRTWSGSKLEIVEEGGKFIVAQKGKPARMFSTRAEAEKAFPYAGREPNVNHEWTGAADPIAAAPPQSFVNEHQPSANGSAPEPQDEPEAFDEFTAPTENTETGAQDVDLDELAQLADAQDDEAQAKLEELAGQHGVEEGSADNGTGWRGASSWAKVVEMIRVAMGGDADGSTEAPDELESFVPEVGSVYQWNPLDLKTAAKNGFIGKDKKIKPGSVEITAVDEDARTVTARHPTTKKALTTADGKKPLSIAFDQLEVV